MRNKLLPYVGLPYQDRGRAYNGVDCWGLVYLYYRDALGVDGFPSYGNSYQDPKNSQEISDTIKARLGEFKTVHPAQRQPNDILLFNIAGQPVHAGVMVDNHLMLHALSGHDSVIEHYTGLKWWKRLAGVIRWPS